MAESNIVGSVTILFDPEAGQAELIPPLGALDRKIQNMQWSLVAPEGFTFSDPGIVFNPPPPLPDGFVPWPGDRPVRDADKCQVRAKVNKKVDETEMYRYDIYVTDPQGMKIQIGRCVDKFGNPIDPDMENRPQP